MTLSQSQLRLLSSIGVGILVGTSLIVIIPEGIEAAASPAETGHVHRVRTLVRRSPWSHYAVPRGLGSSIPTVNTVAGRSPLGDEDADALVRRVVASVGPREPLENESEPPETSTIPAEENLDDTDGKSNDKAGNEKAETGKDELESGHDDDDDEHAHAAVPTFEIGFSMILGFVLMFLIDRLPRHATESLHSSPQTRHISLDNLGGDTASVEDEEEGFLGSLTPTPRRARSLATTTGLVIHAAADGIAMGASSTTTDMKLGFIIFVAIMIHKAPAAFGLTSLLLKQGLSKRAARGHLIVFSLAAPVGALITWLVITLLGAAGHDGDHWWTGMLLLFSGGTFLYVAMHAMQEDGSSHGHGHEHSVNGYADSNSAVQRKPKGPQMRDTLATVGGMLVPLLTQFGHHH
ncbi:ZIP zinc transporter-domain-containing protein [Ilyonectria robusta]|uniref:ZIP zinc transporter-domain-containing protein n=1 Tax=Ilyonectria robusta TaxID=1079257 RepID=UPI001E8E0AE2|nr:ZIP zinc transporter-domain-containing protein [Ilyonectria robusta]KAH8686744.1 ZIP zinc transporter-domain-containing protein [Ilyonectria robusta]